MSQLCPAEVSREAMIRALNRDLETYSEFKYGRYMRTELETCALTNSIAQDKAIMSFFNANLNVLLEPLYKQYHLFNGTSNSMVSSCVQGLYDQLFINDVEDMHLCIATARKKQISFDNAIKKAIGTYKKDAEKMTNGVKQCLTKFPNHGSNALWDQCYKTHHRRFFAKYDRVTAAYLNSPCMENFLSEFLNICLVTKFDSMKKNAEKLTGQLETCASLDEYTNISIQTAVLDSTDIVQRIKAIQKIYIDKNEHIRKQLIEYYDMEKKWQNTVKPVESIDQVYTELVQHFSGYFTAINQTLRDNPSQDHTNCGYNARSTMHSLLCKASIKKGVCYEQLQEKTVHTVHSIREQLFKVMQHFPKVSNIAILNCIKQVYIFGNNTLEECYDLAKRRFELAWESTLEDVERNVSVVEVATARGECDGGSLKGLTLAADETLFEYRTCLAKAAGEPGPLDYPVTLPPKSPNQATVPVRR